MLSSSGVKSEWWYIMFPKDGACLKKLNQHLSTLPGRLTALLGYNPMQTFPAKKYARNLQDPFRNSNSKPCHKYLYASYIHCSNDELSRLVPCCCIVMPTAVISNDVLLLLFLSSSSRHGVIGFEVWLGLAIGMPTMDDSMVPLQFPYFARLLPVPNFCLLCM